VEKTRLIPRGIFFASEKVMRNGKKTYLCPRANTLRPNFKQESQKERKKILKEKTPKKKKKKDQKKRTHLDTPALK